MGWACSNDVPSILAPYWALREGQEGYHYDKVDQKEV